MPPLMRSHEETAMKRTPTAPLETELFHNSTAPADFSETTDDGIFNDDVGTPSNERLLATAFVSFLSFASLQLVFAFIANSEAMKGDSAAMMVDSMTYLFNWVAEHRKHHYSFDSNNHEDPERVQKIRERTYRKMVLQMEIIPPVLSVSTLLIVTVIVTRRAVFVLMRGPTALRHPNLRLMMGFSLFNLGLDFVNVFCFARAKHLTGYATTTATSVEEHEQFESEQQPGYMSPDQSEYCRNGTVVENNRNCNGRQHAPLHSGNGYVTVADDTTNNVNGKQHISSSQHTGEEDEEKRPNLNMCSAYTHVLADTLRSFAVIFAALTALLVPVVTPEQADATAAIVVSGLIVLSLAPLLKGLIQSIRELQSILGEERAEAMLVSSTHHANSSI